MACFARVRTINKSQQQNWHLKYLIRAIPKLFLKGVMASQVLSMKYKPLLVTILAILYRQLIQYRHAGR